MSRTNCSRILSSIRFHQATNIIPRILQRIAYLFSGRIFLTSVEFGRRFLRPTVLGRRTLSLEWTRAPDCSPPPLTLFLAAPDRRMDALWTGDRRLLHPVSPHAGSSGLPGRFPLLDVFGQLRSVCLLSFPLAPLDSLSVCPVSISRTLVHPGIPMHRRIGSYCAPLGRAPDTPQLGHGRRPGIRRCDHSHRMECTLFRDQALRHRRAYIEIRDCSAVASWRPGSRTE
jgi:hypothetical protein